MRSRNIVVVVAAACLQSVGCSWSTTTEDPRVCTVPVTAEVSGAAPARISWTPHCGIKEVHVRAVTGGQASGPTLWLVAAENLPVFPVVEYGIAPAGTVTYIGPTTLVRGQTYEVELVPIATWMAPTRVTWRP